MKIVFINPVGIVGGAEKVLLSILAALRTTQPESELHLIVGTEGVLIEKAKAIGVQVTILELPPSINQLGDSALKRDRRLRTKLTYFLRILRVLPAVGQYLKQFRQVIQNLNPDLIYSNGIKSHLLTALANFRQIPVVWHIHDFYGTRPLVAQVLRLISGNVKKGVAISEAVATDARATIPNLPIQVIYNAIDINYFSPQPLTTPSDEIKIGLVATFARWKGQDIFLDAAAKLISKNPSLNVRFHIIGGAIYKTKGSQFSEAELSEKAEQLGIRDRVEFSGFQEDIATVYRNLDIVVHASTQPEPFGLTIIEAMACGKPVIVSQAGGAVELCTHDYDAIGVPPNDSEALASAMKELIDSPEKRQFLGRNARETVVKRFNQERLGKEILALYEELSRA